jgi:type VI secretion system protein ImpM
MKADHVLHVGYFGKLPSRPDFVKGGDQHQLATLLDEWIAGTMAALAGNPRWKQHYDAFLPMDFAFVGPRSSHAIAGHLRASSDQSLRRFPFVFMTVIEVDGRKRALHEYPQLFSAFWDDAGRAAAISRELAVSVAVHGSVADAAPDLVSLQSLLARDGRPFSVRGIMMGIGLLLQPFRWNGTQRLDRGIVLPLPHDPAAQISVASYWLSLVAPFVRDADLELALFLTRRGGQPALAIGFSGASPAALQAMIDPEFAAQHQITFDDTGWVDEMIQQDGAVLRLGACLEQGSLSLSAARQVFLETFA